MKRLLGAMALLLPFALTGWASNSRVEMANQPFVVAGAESPRATDGLGCYLNFKASNKGTRSILIDISRSRIKLYGAVGWNEIKNTSNRNVQANSTANFTVWAKLCGGTTKHVVRFYIKRSDGDTRQFERRHSGQGSTTDLGDLNAQF